MLILSRVRNDCGGFICRRCMNTAYRLQMTQYDCLYENPYPRRCSCCGEMRNIVTGLRFGGKLKSLFK